MDLFLLHRVDGDVEHLLVGDLLHLRVAHQPHRPRRIVVGAEVRIRVDLLLEQRLGEAAVRLIALDDERAGGEGAFLELHLSGRAADLDPLHAQQVDQALDARHVALAGGNHVAGDAFPCGRSRPSCATSRRSSRG